MRAVIRPSAGPLHIFKDARVATFLDRPNRFLVRCRLGGRTVKAFLPNPGRLRELLLPGRPMHLVREEDHPTRKTRYTAVAVERAGHPVVLHTHRTNDVARHLVEQGLVPGLKGARVTRAEVKVGRSRFDFLLSHRGADVLLEVKSCTLAGERVAMFPDAVTERGARHVRELAEIAEQGTRTAVLFVAQWPHAEIFMPDFHTDPEFTRTLLACRRSVETRAVSVRWDQRLVLLPEARVLKIPWSTVERESGDRGSYLVLLHLSRTRVLPIGRLGDTHFPKGFYLYVGSAMANLSQRVARHRRLHKRIHWHIDRLRPHTRFVEALPIRSSDRLECELARALEGISSWSIPGFGCSDCRCKSHLFGMRDNPLDNEALHDLLAWYRMDRLALTRESPSSYKRGKHPQRNRPSGGNPVAKNFNAWPQGWPKSLNYPEIPVHAFLDQTAERVPNRIAIIFGGMELTYGELKELSERFAAALAGMGVGKGDRVAIHLPNCPQFAIAYYGALKIGAIFTPLSPLLAPREARHQLKDSGAETLISLDLLYPGISSILPETGVKRVVTTSIADCYNAIIAPLKPLGKTEVPDTMDMASLLKQHEPDVPEVSIDVRKDLVHLAYTGGTTGLSKGVALTHFNVVANAFQFGHWFTGAGIEMIDGKITPTYPPGVDPERDRGTTRDIEVSLVVVPWFHAMGTVGYLNNQVLGGNTMVVLPKFEAREYLEAVVKYKATLIGGAPQLFIPLVSLPDFKSYDLSGIKMAGSGAAPLAMPVLDKMLDAFTGVVIEAYGLSECTMGATSNPPDRSTVRHGSVGMPVYDTECKVVDAETGEDLPPGSVGEICIKGPQVMQGYWNRPEETADVLKDGWLHTGDIGREDEDGFFYITDRKKDLIIYKGYNVYPREIEEVIFEHPAVQQCAVVGRPDIEVGEAPVAFVELQQGAEATREEIMEHTNSQIAHYKKIREVVFVDQIPVSGAGKVLKRDLREQLKKD